jgi:hypothetical protein
MTRSCLILASAAAVAACNAIVGVEDLTIAPADAVADASITRDAPEDSTKDARASSGGDAREPAADATLAPDEGPADVATEDAIADATPGEAAPDASGMDGEAAAPEGGMDGEAAAEGAMDGEAAVPEADAGALEDSSAEAGPTSDEASLSDDGSATDASAFEGD